MRIALLLGACLALTACNASFGGAPLISGQSPPSANAANSEPQSANSLPPGAEGIGAKGPNGRFPNAASVTLSLPH